MNLLKKLAGVFMTYSVCYALLAAAYAYMLFKGRTQAWDGVNIALMLSAGLYTIYFYCFRGFIRNCFGRNKEVAAALKEYEEERAARTHDRINEEKELKREEKRMNALKTDDNANGKKGMYYPMVADAEQRLRSICKEAIGIKYGDDEHIEALERMEYEFLLLKRQGTEFAFLYMRELMRTLGLKASDVIIRGTGAGSMIAYLCDISQLDPLKYDLDQSFGSTDVAKKHLDLTICIPTHMMREAIAICNAMEGVDYVVELIPNMDSMISHVRLMFVPEHGDGDILPADIKDLRSCPELAVDTDLFYVQSILAMSGLDILRRLSMNLGIDPAGIPTDDKELLEFFTLNMEDGHLDDISEFCEPEIREMVKKSKPENFEELADVLCKVYGDAFSKAQALSYMLVSWRLGWFKIHYPEKFAGYIKELNYQRSGMPTVENDRKSRRIIAMDDVVSAVCGYFEVDKKKLLSSRRIREVEYPRDIAIYLSRELTGCSIFEIGMRFGHKPYTEMLFSHQKIRRQAEEDGKVWEDINNVRKVLFENRLNVC